MQATRNASTRAKLVSAALILLMLLTLAPPAYAQEDAPPVSWEEAAAQMAELEPGSSFAIYMVSDSVVPGSFLKAVAGLDVELVFDMGGGLSWSANCMTIPAGELDDLDLGVESGHSLVPIHDTGGMADLHLHANHTGALPFRLWLTVELGAEYAGLWADLMYFEYNIFYLGHSSYDSLIWCDGDEIGQDGAAIFAFDHMSDYVIIIDETSLNPEQDPWENPFDDISEDDWFYDDVALVVDAGLFAGVGGSSFGPDLPMTRAMLVTVLWRIEGKPEVELMYGDFADVVQMSYYEAAVAWASKNELVGGYGEGFFGPDESITREQLATILWRYAKLREVDVSVGEDTNILSFDDAFDISEYAVSAMQWACGAGVIGGRPGGLLDPQGSASRAEVAAMLRRFISNYL